MPVPIGAKVLGSRTVPKNQNRKIAFTTVCWDTGNFYAASQPRRLRVRAVHAGRYVAQLAARWHLAPGATGPPADPTSSYYYAAIKVNNQSQGPDARSTVHKVPHATGTTQLIVHEADLVGGDRVQAEVYHAFDEPTAVDVILLLRRVGDSV